MADIKITDLAAYNVPTSTDVLAVVDVGSNITKKVSIADMMENAGTGTAAAPSISFDGDNDTGLFLSASNTIGVATAGGERLNISSTGQFDFKAAGTNSAPTIAFAGDVNTGIYQPAADQVGITAGGTQALVVAATGVTVPGNLTVQGTTTTIDSTTLTVEDKNIEIGKVSTPSDTTADGGGITLKGATDHTITWVNASDSWDFSEHVNLASGKEFKINGTSVLSASTLGSGVTASSLTSVGTITTGVWNGTAIAAANLDSTVVTTSDTGTVTSTMIANDTIVNTDINASAAIADTKLGTISTSGKVTNNATTATNANTASAIVARDGSGNFSAGTITADLTGNADSATALETARNIGGVSFDGTANIDLPGVNASGTQDTSGNAGTATKLSSNRAFALTGDVTGTVNSDLTSGASIAASIAAGVILDADVNASAAIAGTKIDADFGDQDLTVDSDRLFVDVSANSVGINCQPAVTLDINATDAVALPHGTSNERPTDANAANLTGYMRFNTTTTQFEGHNGTAWGSIGGGATGGGSDQWAVEHDNTITASYSVTANRNVISAGPLTINSGAVITVPATSNWVIV